MEEGGGGGEEHAFSAAHCIPSYYESQRTCKFRARQFSSTVYYMPGWLPSECQVNAVQPCMVVCIMLCAFQCNDYCCDSFTVDQEIFTICLLNFCQLLFLALGTLTKIYTHIIQC